MAVGGVCGDEIKVNCPGQFCFTLFISIKKAL